MNPDRLLPLLACPECRGDLELRDDVLQSGRVRRGRLACAACARSWPVVEGVPDFVSGAGAAPAVEQTTAGFARNWARYRDVILSDEALNERLLREWLGPLPLEAVAGQRVLEVGCGMGRWLRVLARQRPAGLIGVDHSEVAWVAARSVADLPGVDVIRGDLFRLPLKPSQDLAVALGVLHHTPDPDGAFGAVWRALQPGGVFWAWVYGAEGSAWVTRGVTPLREAVTARLPDPALHALSRALTVPLWAVSRLVDRLPAGLPVPSREYLSHLQAYPRRYLEHIVYDHLVPSLAAYLRRDEVASWAERRGLCYHLSSRNENSWRLIASRERAPLEAVLEPSARAAVQQPPAGAAPTV